MGLAVTSLVLGIASIFPGCCLASIGGMTVLGILAVVFGLIAMSHASQGRAGGRGLAVGGVVTGAIGGVLGLVMVALMIFGHVAAQGFGNWGQRYIQKQQQIQQQQQSQPAPTTQGSGDL